MWWMSLLKLGYEKTVASILGAVTRSLGSVTLGEVSCGAGAGHVGDRCLPATTRVSLEADPLPPS